MIGERPAVIRTARLVLKGYEERDKEPMIALLTNEEIRKTFMIPELPDRESREALFYRLKTISEKPDRIEYGIYRDGELIGFMNDCGIEGDSIELGYVIDPAHKGQGCASEALAAVIEALFQMGFSRVTAEYFEGNEASRRVMEKSGMHPTGEAGTVTYRGTEHRCLGYAIERD